MQEEVNYEELLRSGIYELGFTKANGDYREAVATMLPEFLPPAKPDAKPGRSTVPSSNLLFYDITVEGFRSCIKANIISFTKVE